MPFRLAEVGLAFTATAEDSAKATLLAPSSATEPTKRKRGGHQQASDTRYRFSPTIAQGQSRSPAECVLARPTMPTG